MPGRTTVDTRVLASNRLGPRAPNLKNHVKHFLSTNPSSKCNKIANPDVHIPITTTIEITLIAFIDQTRVKSRDQQSTEDTNTKSRAPEVKQE